MGVCIVFKVRAQQQQVQQAVSEAAAAAGMDDKACGQLDAQAQERMTDAGLLSTRAAVSQACG